MNLTKYVIELAIAGIGTITWILLILLTLIEVNWGELSLLFKWVTPFEIVTSLFLVLGPFVYVIGIVNDRLVDNLFDSLFAKKILKNNFSTKEDYQRAIANICINSEALMSRFNYGRMRIRICRAWSFNSFFILAALNLFLWFRLGEIGEINAIVNVQDKIPVLSFFFSTLFVISAFVSFFAWKTLMIKECAHLKVQSKLITELRGKKLNRLDEK